VPYEFDPPDLDDPRGERRAADRPADRVGEAFQHWLANYDSVARREIGGSVSDELYDLAAEALADVDVRAPDATATVLRAGQGVPPEVGLFLSAAYNQAPESVVVFDLSLPVGVKHLGFRLPREKSLVLAGSVASAMGVDSEGLVVNRTDVESYFGYGADGAFVNAPEGSCLTFGLSSVAVGVDLGEIRGSTGSDTVVHLAGTEEAPARTVPTADVVSGSPLADYLDDLRTGLSGDHESVRRFLEGLEPDPRTALERRLREVTAGGD
jgi:hypothetical protein